MTLKSLLWPWFDLVAYVNPRFFLLKNVSSNVFYIISKNYKYIFVVCFPALLKPSTMHNAYTYNTGNDFTTFYPFLHISDKSVACVEGIGIFHSARFE